MRRSLLILFVFVSIGICATGVHAAQTDCQRWWKEYREALAHSPAVHHIRHVRHRVHRAATKRLASFVHPHSHPAPKILPARQRLHPTRKQVRHAFDFACGDLPDTEDAELLDLDRPTDFISDLDLPEQPLDAVSPGPGPIALSEVPQYPGNSANLPPVVDVPPVFGPIFGPGGASPIIPTLPSTPGIPSAPAPQSPVPEPESLVFVLTGVLGAIGAARRRLS